MACSVENYVLDKTNALIHSASLPLDSLLAGEKLDGSGSLPQQIYRLIRKLIVEMRLMPNRIISENEVATCLQISKTPVREALIRLSEDGMVVVVPKSGTFVSPIDLDRAREGYFIRSMLESGCVAQLAQSCSQENISRLRGELAAQKNAIEAGEFKTFYRLDNRFHAAFFEIASLLNAMRLMETAKFEVDRIRTLRMMYGVSRLNEVFAEHTAIVDAIADRDPEAARTRMLDHFQGINDMVKNLVQDRNFWTLFHLANNSPKGGRRPRAGKHSR